MTPVMRATLGANLLHSSMDLTDRGLRKICLRYLTYWDGQGNSEDWVISPPGLWREGRQLCCRRSIRTCASRSEGKISPFKGS